MDFARSPGEPTYGRQLTDLLDAAIVARKREEYATRGSGIGEVAAKRIGAGYIGLECDRQLAYRFHRAEKEERDSVVSPGELERHALSGHWTEASIADWLRLAGFDLHTLREDGRQFGYQVARHPETGQAQIAGEIDGVLLGGPLDGIPYPCLWESKKATAKKFSKFTSKGVAKADPVYYGQVQTNMAYLEVYHTLFSMLCLDTMAFYWELLPLDPAEAQRLTDRAVRVIQSATPEEMPRIGHEPTDWRCKFCDFHGRCWERKEAAAEAPGRPAWLGARA